MERESNGKFMKALVKVGQQVVCITGGFNPGFTQYKPYKVLATCRSGIKNRMLCDKLNGTRIIEKECEVIIKDNDGLLRIISLHPDARLKMFGHWTLLPCQK